MTVAWSAARRGTLAAGLALGLVGCGFKLRQSASLPFDTLYNGLGDGSLSIEFERQVRLASGTLLVRDPTAAQARLLLVQETRAKEAVSFSPIGRPREFQLNYRVVFRVLDSDNVEVLRPTTIALRRYITTSDIELLSQQLEEEFLYREMQNDMVQQMLRRLAAIPPGPR